LLKHAELQRTATTEHAVIRDRKGFRKIVLERLKRISKLLPANHPVRREIAILDRLEK
jgi:hypothetical protein